MTISIDLNGGASGSDATTAFTEQSIVSLFSSAALSANGGDSNSIDTVTLTLASATQERKVCLSMLRLRQQPQALVLPSITTLERAF
jgi:hypothetical protein